jgi:hypothetical protein
VSSWPNSIPIVFIGSRLLAVDVRLSPRERYHVRLGLKPQARRVQPRQGWFETWQAVSLDPALEERQYSSLGV